MDILIIKVISIAMFTLFVVFSVISSFGAIWTMLAKRRHPPRDQSEAYRYRKAFDRITACYIGAVGAFFCYTCLSSWT